MAPGGIHRHIARATCAALLALSAFGAQAQAAADCFTKGHWRGTLGAAPVHLVFRQPLAGEPVIGRYHYRDNLQDLLLDPDPVGLGHWRELDARNRASGRLQLACEGDTLSGTWSSHYGQRTLAVKAARIPTDDYGAARLARAKPKTQVRRLPSGQEYELFAIEPFSTTGLRLRGSGPVIERLNASLRREFLEALASGMECTATNRLLGARDVDGGFAIHKQWSVVEWNARFLLVGVAEEGYCVPAAHPYHGARVDVIRMDTGDREDTTGWLRPEYAKGIPRDSALGRMLFAEYRKVRGEGEGLADCTEDLSLYPDGLFPTRAGITFDTSFSYAMSACREDVPLAWSRVASFLGARGREVMEFYRSLP